MDTYTLYKTNSAVTKKHNFDRHILLVAFINFIFIIHGMVAQSV
jgi:hypothetical protein